MVTCELIVQENEKEEFERILMSITSKYPSISKDELLRMVNEKINSLGGMVNKDVAALLVAQSLGLDVTDLVSPYKKSYKSKILASGLRGITLIGKVAYISPIRTISNNKERTFVSVILNDENGQNIEVTFWGDMVHNALKLRMGFIVEIHGGTVKELTPEPRINVSRGSIKVISKEEPTFKNTINERMACVVIDGVITDLYETDDESYPIAALIKTNGLQHRILLTHEQSNNLRNNTHAIFKGCFVKSISENVADLMMSIDGIVNTDKEETSSIKTIVSVDDLYNFNNPSYVNVNGLVHISDYRIFLLGSKFCIPVKIINKQLTDGPYILKGALLENLHKPSLIIDKFTKVVQGSNEIEKDVVQWQLGRYYYVYGFINAVKYINSVQICPSCGSQLGSWEKTCNRCGYKGPFNLTPEISFIIDNTESIEIILRGKEAESLIGYDAQAISDAIELGIYNHLKDAIESSIKNLKLVIGGQLKEIKPLIVAKEVYKLKNNKYDKIMEEEEDGREEEKEEASKESYKEAT